MPGGLAARTFAVNDSVGPALPPVLLWLNLLEEEQEQGSRPGGSRLRLLFRLQKMVTERAIPLQMWLIFDRPGSQRSGAAALPPRLWRRLRLPLQGLTRFRGDSPGAPQPEAEEALRAQAVAVRAAVQPLPLELTSMPWIAMHVVP